MYKNHIKRFGKYTVFCGINTRQLSIGLMLDKNCIAFDFGIVWISLGWN